MTRIETARQHLESRGLRVTLARNIDATHRGYLAGPDDFRLEEVNRLLREPGIDAFLFARGGYGAMRILDRIDFDALAADPRPVIGFSDITAIHQAMAVRAGVAGFHGPMVNLDFHDELSTPIEDWFWSMLAGEAPLTHSFGSEQIVCEGDATGPLFGGCLSLTVALLGTPYDFWIDDGIWFWEDVDEPVYRVDRMLTHLRLSGRMQRVRGVVLGKLKSCGGEAEMQALLRETFGSIGIPVVRDLPFGHQGDNLLMPIGVPARLSTDDRSFTILESAVERNVRI
jgi:muramoyltetrapeptide carboxypeptidase